MAWFAYTDRKCMCANLRPYIWDWSYCIHSTLMMVWVTFFFHINQNSNQTLFISLVWFPLLCYILTLLPCVCLSFLTEFRISFVWDDHRTPVRFTEVQKTPETSGNSSFFTLWYNAARCRQIFDQFKSTLLLVPWSCCLEMSSYKVV